MAWEHPADKYAEAIAALKEMVAWAPRLSLADQPQNQPMRDSVIAWGRVVRDAQAVIRKAENK